VLICVVALVVLVGAGFLVMRGDSGGSGDPAQAVRDFFAAAQERDCEGMLSLVTEASWSQNGTVDKQGALQQCAESIQDDDFLPPGAQITDVKVLSQDGDKAQVQVSSNTDESGPLTETIPVVKEDGHWLVDFATEAASSAPLGG
jgi:hypothetical protein